MKARWALFGVMAIACGHEVALQSLPPRGKPGTFCASLGAAIGRMLAALYSRANTNSA